MRIAALDVGDARIGVAVSDELGITAQGIGVVQRVGGRRDLEALARMLAPYAPERIVVGLPQAVIITLDQLRTGQMGPIRLLFLLVLMICVIAAIVFVEQIE